MIIKKLSPLVGLLLLVQLVFAQPGKTTLAIIPEPVNMLTRPGYFTLPKQVVIATGTTTGVQPVAVYLKDKLSGVTGSLVSIKHSPAIGAAIQLIINKTADAAIGKEGYRLAVTAKGIVIKANEPAGLFYGVQTLLQLFPKEIESTEQVSLFKWKAPYVDITDYPRFGWRGLMFDVSRHFFTKAEVKQFIDEMVRYKFNLLHLHLTDDEGWRIEIKSLPRLTTVGAYNVKRVGQFGSFAPVTPDEPRTYGGFYTQEDIKELVQYAKERFVNIMPEIDVPGHSMAAVASYPELSCTPEAVNYQVSSGGPIMNWNKNGFTAINDNTLCPANEKVYVFLDKVITEVAQLFPFGYIHMGGDECAKNYWEKSDAVKALMEKEGLKTMDEVQGYFEKRLQKIVESKGKKFIAWDEVDGGGMGPDAAVMGWRGMAGGTKAAKQGHEVVMSPSTYVYLDYMQSDRVTEPPVYASLRLNKSYQFEPVPDSVDAKFILGAQGNLWTEQVYNMRQVEYMVWPRGFAIAETAWSPKLKKDWNNFYPKVEKHFARLNEADIKYAPSVYDPGFNASITPDNQLKIELTTEIPDLDIYYSFDNSYPDRHYPKYTEPMVPPKDAIRLRVVTYRGKTQLGRMVTMPLDELDKRTGRKITAPAK